MDAFRRGLDAYNRRDVEAMVDGADPDVTWQPGVLRGLGGQAAVYRGHEGVREGFRDLFEALGETRLDYPDIRDIGDRIVAIGSFRARGMESGAETESPHATVVDYKDGKAIRIRSYFDPDDALEAAGLSE